MHHSKTKPNKSKLYVLLYKQQGFQAFHNNFVGKKLISGIVAYGIFEINYGWPWFISNVP